MSCEETNMNNFDDKYNPPLPPLQTPIYQNGTQVGNLNHMTMDINLYGNALPYKAMGTSPGAFVQDHMGNTIGTLGPGGNILPFKP